MYLLRKTTFISFQLFLAFNKLVDYFEIHASLNQIQSKNYISKLLVPSEIFTPEPAMCERLAIKVIFMNFFKENIFETDTGTTCNNLKL